MKPKIEFSDQTEKIICGGLAAWGMAIIVAILGEAVDKPLVQIALLFLAISVPLLICRFLILSIKGTIGTDTEFKYGKDFLMIVGILTLFGAIILLFFNVTILLGIVFGITVLFSFIILIFYMVLLEKQQRKARRTPSNWDS